MKFIGQVTGALILFALFLVVMIVFVPIAWGLLPILVIGLCILGLAKLVKAIRAG